MVMLGWQDDGTMGPNINTSIVPAKPGSTAALARQANSGGIGAALAQQQLQNRQQTTAQQTTQAQTVSEEKSNGPGSGANRGSTRGSRRRMMGSAGTAFAGNVGSVNTEVQNDDVLLPYQKGNM